jgi:PEP-CTERM motif
MKRCMFGLAAMGLVWVGAGQAKAAPIFTNLGAGGSYNTSSGWTVGGINDFIQGFAFTPSYSAELGEFRLAIEIATATTAANGPNEFLLDLRSNVGGSPGPVIEHFDITGQMSLFDGDQHPLVVVSSKLHPLLTAETEYWLIASPVNNPNEIQQLVWNLNSTGDTGPKAISIDGGTSFVESTQTRGAFEADPLATPEPSTFILFGLGLVAMAFYEWRRRKVAVA